MAKLVCLVTAGAPETAFARRIHDELDIDLLVVVEPASARVRLVRAWRRGGPAGLVDLVFDRVARAADRRRRQAGLVRWLGEDWRALPDGIPTIRVGSSMDPGLLQAVRGFRDDVDLVVHASVLVGVQLLAECRTALNLHWGLSPYYRGTHCTEWALLHEDTCNIGVTVHELAREIDGGRIVAQERATLSVGDTVASIDAQLTSLGAELVCGALRIVRDGLILAATPQDLNLGQITFKRQWSRHLRRQVRRLERSGLQDAITHPTRDPLPIVAGPRPQRSSEAGPTQAAVAPA